MPRFSVVIPVFNGGRFIADTLHSIIGQSRPPEQILVIDDGSSDDSAAIARSVGPQITVMSQDNQGVQAARNRGIGMACGDWIALCDADDLWDAAYLERATLLLEERPELDFVFTNFRRLEGGRLAALSKFDQAPSGWWEGTGFRAVRHGWVFESSIAGSTFVWHPIFPSATLVKRSLVDQVGGFDTSLRGSRAEDGEFTLRCLYEARVGAVPDPLVTIRRHDQNTSGDQLLVLISEVEALRAIRSGHPQAAQYRPVIDAEIVKRRLQAVELAFVRKDHALARRLLADVALSDRSGKLKIKAFCASMPDVIGLPLNTLLQSLTAVRRGS